MPTFACDVSYFQPPVDDRYPHHWLIYRVCDGTFRDPNFGKNNTWARNAAAKGRIAGHTAYCVYRPGADTLGTVKAMVGKPDKYLTVMIDVESWGGQIGGDHSTQINALVDQLAAWLGDRRRVIAYGNQGDLAAIYPRRRSGLRLIVAGYSSVQPQVPGMVGWQFSDGSGNWPVPAGFPRSSAPFGHCDHNVFPGLSPQQLAATLGVGGGTPVSPVSPQDVNSKEQQMIRLRAQVAALQAWQKLAMARNKIRDQRLSRLERAVFHGGKR